MLQIFEKIKITKDMKLAMVATTLTALIFILYLIFIGIPMTEARNQYNIGVKYYNNKAYQKARQVFENSQEIWKTNDTQEYLDKLEEID